MRDGRDDRFFRVPRIPRQTSEGVVELPILYYEVSNLVAVFDAPLEATAKLLEGTGLVPVAFGHRAGIALSFYDYRETSVGRYNEVGTAILAVRRADPRPRLGWADLLLPPRRRTIGAYVLDLPVTTKAANAAGRELWGYPKFVTDIPLLLAGRDFECSVMDPAGRDAILRLHGHMGPGLPAPPLSLMTYTLLDGALVRTHVDVRGMVTACSPGDLRLAVGPSAHPMAEHLRALDLDGARPWAVLRTDRFQSKLHAGEKVA